MQDVILAAVERLRSDLGWTVQDVTPEWGSEGRTIGRLFWAAMQSKFLPNIDACGDLMSPDLLACARAGANYSVSEYHLMRERKNAYTTRIENSLQDVRFLITPVASVAAFPVDGVRPAHWPEHDGD